MCKTTTIDQLWSQMTNCMNKNLFYLTQKPPNPLATYSIRNCLQGQHNTWKI